MKREEFLKIVIEKINSAEQICETTNLLDIKEWDSLTIIIILSLFSKYFDITVSPVAIDECDTVGDLADLAKEYLNDTL